MMRVSKMMMNLRRHSRRMTDLLDTLGTDAFGEHDGVGLVGWVNVSCAWLVLLSQHTSCYENPLAG